MTAWNVLAAQQTLSLRFLGSDFSLWPDFSHFIPNPNDRNARALIFNLPQGFPTDFDGETNKTEFWDGTFSYPSAINFPDDSLSHNWWPALTNGFQTFAACGGETTNDFVTVTTTAYINDSLWPMSAQSTVDDALQVALGWWATNADLPGEVFTPRDFKITLQIKGGSFDGREVTLPAAVATAAVHDASDTPHLQRAAGDLFLTVDLGVDLMTNRQFLIFQMTVLAYASGGENCLSLPQLCQQWLGSPGALPFAQTALNNIRDQLTSGQAYIQGALPESLFFYDFSTDYTISPPKTINARAWSPPGADFSAVNQYNAGLEFTLPTASDDSRPGGNACGPMSLIMAMNAAGLDAYDLRQVFANTMEHGMAPNGTTNNFYWSRAKAWLQAKTSFEGTPFPDPLPFPVPVDFINYNLLRNVGWAQIDSLLASRRQPVLFRTDLGAGAGDQIGGGHVILLLGKGHSDNLAQLYGTSGDYYVVADPAGHFYADTDSQKHYQTVELLQDENLAINYGGWFAIYPVERLKTRITLKGAPVVRALTIGAPFNSHLEIQAQSPVTIMVTDPVGNQSGIETNGTVLEGIPQSTYEPAVADSEDGSSVDPNGPKTVRIDQPMAGTYRVDLIGTNSGPYTLVWEEFDSNGTQVGTNGYTGTISPGQQVTYLINAAPVGPPPLLLTRQAAGPQLFWPTNYTGFTLQTTANLSDPNSWASVSGVSVVGGFNVASPPLSTGSHCSAPLPRSSPPLKSSQRKRHPHSDCVCSPV